MPKLFNVNRSHVLRAAVLLFLVTAVLLNSACGLFRASKRVQVPQLLEPLADANKDRLIQEANRLSTTKSLHGRIDIQFEDTSFAVVGSG